MTEQTISAEQLEQAIQQVVVAVDWSKPPDSDTVSYGQRRRANDQALSVIVMCARQAMKQQTPVDQTDIPHVPEMADVSSNGDGET